MSGSIVNEAFGEDGDRNGNRRPDSEPRLRTWKRVIPDDAGQVTPESDDKMLSRTRESLVKGPSGKQVKSLIPKTPPLPLVKTKVSTEMYFDEPNVQRSTVVKNTSISTKGIVNINSKLGTSNGNISNGFVSDLSKDNTNSHLPIPIPKSARNAVGISGQSRQPHVTKPSVSSKLANGTSATTSYSTVTIRGIEMKKVSTFVNPIPPQPTTFKAKASNSKLQKKPAASASTSSRNNNSSIPGPSSEGKKSAVTEAKKTSAKTTSAKAASSTVLVAKVPSGIPIVSSEPNPKPKKPSPHSQDSFRDDPSPREGSEDKHQQPLFRSQFWSFVDPKKYPPKETPKKDEREKPYDPTEVKSFMEKKKEIRRLKEKHDMAERQMEIERRQAQLRELETKRREICAKASAPRKAAPADFVLVQDQRHHPVQAAKSSSVPVKVQSKTKKPAVKSASKKNADAIASVPKGVVDDKSKHKLLAGILTREDRMTDMILQEFETIVHRECVSVLRQHTDRMLSNLLEPSPENILLTTGNQEDKAVGTTQSLFDEDTESVSTYKSHPLYVQSPGSNPKRFASDSFEVRNNAALKIQAAYRSYRIRKVWHEVHDWREQRNRPRRRISFYRAKGAAATHHVETPERPFVQAWASNRPRKLAAMSPAPAPCSGPEVSDSGKGKTAFGISVDFSSYIPAPEGYMGNSTQNSSGISSSTSESSRCFRNTGIPSAIGTKATPGRFEEPFPREAIKQLLLQSPKPTSTEGMGLGRRSLTNFYASPAGLGLKPSESRLITDRRSLSSVPKEARDPTFYTVLKEQIRLLQEKVHDRDDQNQGETRHSSAPGQLGQDVDSDSTEHQSLHDQDGTISRTSTPTLSITDDYIGPNMEHMKIAYSLRCRDRLSLEPNIRTIQPRIGRALPRDTGRARDVSIGSTTTVETDDELRDSEVNETRPRARPSETEVQSTETTYDSHDQDSLPTPLRNFQNKLEEERRFVLEAANKFTTEIAAQQRAEADAFQHQVREDNANVGHYKQILTELLDFKAGVQTVTQNAALLQTVSESVKAVAESLNRPPTVIQIHSGSNTRLGLIPEDMKDVKTQTSVQEEVPEPEAETESSDTDEQSKSSFVQSIHAGTEEDETEVPIEADLSEKVEAPTEPEHKEAEVAIVAVAGASEKLETRIDEPKQSDEESLKHDLEGAWMIREESRLASAPHESDEYSSAFESESEKLSLTKIQDDTASAVSFQQDVSNEYTSVLDEAEPTPSEDIKIVETETEKDQTHSVKVSEVQQSYSDQFIESEVSAQIEKETWSEDVLKLVEISDALKSVEIENSEALKSVEISEALNSVEISEALKCLEISEALKSVEISEVLKSVDISEALKSVGNSEALNNTESGEKLFIQADVSELLEGENFAKTVTIDDSSTAEDSASKHEFIPENDLQFPMDKLDVSKPDIEIESVTTVTESEPEQVVENEKSVKELVSEEFLEEEDVSPTKSFEEESTPKIPVDNPEANVQNERSFEKFPVNDVTLVQETEVITEPEQFIENQFKIPQDQTFIISERTLTPEEPEVESKDVTVVEERVSEPESKPSIQLILLEEDADKKSSVEDGHMDVKTESDVAVAVENSNILAEEPKTELNENTFVVEAPISSSGFSGFQNADDQFLKSGDDQDEEEWFEDELMSLPGEDGNLKQEAAKILEESRRIENEIRQLEALQVKASSQDVPTKPPPPYVPPPTAPSAQSPESLPPHPAYLVSCEEQKLIFLIESRINAVWEPWTQTGRYPFERTTVPKEAFSGASTARSFDVCVKDVIEEVLQAVLQVEPSTGTPSKMYDTVRLGPLTHLAQKTKLPKNKEELAQAVLERVVYLIPPELLIRKKNSSIPTEGGFLWRKKLKWAARPRDLVDEALVEELIEEDRLWLETGPEEVDIMEELCSTMIKKLVQQVLDNTRAVELRNKQKRSD